MAMVVTMDPKSVVRQATTPGPLPTWSRDSRITGSHPKFAYAARAVVHPGVRYPSASGRAQRTAQHIAHAGTSIAHLGSTLRPASPERRDRSVEIICIRMLQPESDSPVAGLGRCRRQRPHFPWSTS